METLKNQRILGLLRYILAGLTFISLCLIFLESICDPDFFWHLSTGRWIVEHLSLPTYDPFNYTTPALLGSGEHFILTSYWLSQILYYGIYYVSNWNGFILSRFIILSIIIYFIYKRARGSDMTILFSIMAVTMIVFSQIYPLERPQVFSFIFFAILLYLLENLKDRLNSYNTKVAKVAEVTKVETIETSSPFYPAVLPYCNLSLLMLLWANMHGGYILGQGVILVYLLAEGLKFLHPSLRPMEKSSYKRFLIIGTAGILSALINPNTYHPITEMWEVFFAGINIREYQTSITIFKSYFIWSMPVYWLLLFMAAISILYGIKKKRFEVQDVVMFAGLGYFSFTQVRYIAFFLIWTAPFISLSLTTLTHPPHPPSTSHDLTKGGKEGLKGGGLKYICVLLSLFIVAILVTKEKEFDNVKNITNFKTGQWVDDYYPEDAVRFIIDNDIKGNMYNYCEWGGYLIWRFYPGKKVFADGRQLYRLQYSQDMHILSAALKPETMGMPYYKAILESYRVRYMVIPLFSWAGEVLPIAAEMIRDKEWIPVFLKANSMVFVKDTPENYNVIHKYSMPKDVFVAELFKMIDDKIKESPRDFCLYIAKGDLYRSQWKFKEAREEYRKVLKINPFNDTAKERLELFNSKMQSEF